MQISKDIIYLIACAINKKEVNEALVKQMDLETIYNICVMQRISACLYPTLKNISGINTQA